MQSDDYAQYQTLCAALEKAKAAFDAAHTSLVERIERKDGSAPLLSYCDAHDLAAEHWMDARRALLGFCRAHPDLCAQDCHVPG